MNNIPEVKIGIVAVSPKFDTCESKKRLEPQ